MKNFIFNITILMSFIIFLVLVYNRVNDDCTENTKKNNAAVVIESPIQLEKPRYKLKRHGCENYVCDSQ